MFALEGQPPGEQLIHHHAEGEDVASSIHRLTGSLLRRHVGHGAQGGGRLGDLLGVLALGQAEVHDLDPAPGGEHDVGGLNIPVDDALLVGGHQALADLDADIQDLFDLQFFLLDALLTGDLLEGFPLDVLHDDEIAPGAALDAVNGGHVGMVERGSRLRLVNEAGLLLGMLGDVRGQEFHGHDALQLGVLGLVNDAHAPLAELIEDLIVENRLTDHGGHRLCIWPI